MKQYLVTIWDGNWRYKKYSYMVGLTDSKSYCKVLRQNTDRFIIEYKGEF